jgi:hypothetical protein
MPARTFTLSPSSGPYGTAMRVSGTGCVGPNAGVAVYFYRPNGEGYNGNGAAAMPDGTWSMPDHYPTASQGPTGKYKAIAVCSNATTNKTYFTYAPQYYRVTA